MQRRSFVTLLGGATAAWPHAARAQQQRMRRVGVLMARAESDPFGQARTEAFRVRLRELGWTDGDNLRIDYRWTAGVAERFRTAAAELVALKPDVILADATPSVVALRRETQTLSIVFVQVTDPVEQGFVASLARPGGNLTGFTNFEPSMGGKWLGLLKEIAPNVTRVAAIFNPTTAPFADSFLRPVEAAAPSHAVVVIRTPVQDAAEVERTIDGFAREPNGGLLTVTDSFLTNHRDRIVALAARHRLPAIYESELWTRIGGLMAYGNNNIEPYRSAATYVDRILKGVKPADLPVQAPTKFELIINLKTAKTLGLTVPTTLLTIADEVIE